MSMTGDSNENTAAESPAAEDHFGLTAEQLAEVHALLADHRWEEVDRILATLHSSGVADFLQSVTPEERRALVAVMQPNFDPDVLAELDEVVREHVVDELGPEGTAAVLSELPSDDAVSVIEDLGKRTQEEILQAIPAEERVAIEDSLSYPEESAGRLMQHELVAVSADWTVGEVIDFLREAMDLPQDFYDLFVIDEARHLVGSVPLSRVLRTVRPVAMSEIMDSAPRSIPVTMDQEDVAFLFRQMNLTSAPVVDENERLVGVITVDDVVDVIDEEASEDIMRLGGVSEEDFYGAFLDTVRSRFTWLLVNLATAFLASAVIALFKDSISQIVALAVLMPIVASMGGNAGTQTMTVAVRALAMKELTSTNAMRAVKKEVLVSAMNGILFALITGMIAGWWFDSPKIGAVIGSAMIINLVAAGFCGTVIPMGLGRLGIDPAVASGIFLTTVTDVVGFMAFLGLATLLLL